MARGRTTPRVGDLNGPYDVQFKNPLQKKEFKRIQKRGMFIGKTFDWSIIRMLGLERKLVDWIDNLC